MSGHRSTNAVKECARALTVEDIDMIDEAHDRIVNTAGLLAHILETAIDRDDSDEWENIQYEMAPAFVDIARRIIDDVKAIRARLDAADKPNKASAR